MVHPDLIRVKFDGKVMGQTIFPRRLELKAKLGNPLRRLKNTFELETVNKYHQPESGMCDLE